MIHRTVSVWRLLAAGLAMALASADEEFAERQAQLVRSYERFVIGACGEQRSQKPKQ